MTKFRTNGACVQAFLKGERSGEVNNLRIANHVDSIALFNYETCIAEYEFATKTLHFNTTRYSNATNKIQHLLKTYIPYAKITIAQVKELKDIPRGTSVLFEVPKRKLMFHSHFNSYWFDGQNYIERHEAFADKKGQERVVDRQRVLEIAQLHDAMKYVTDVEASFQ